WDCDAVDYCSSGYGIRYLIPLQCLGGTCVHHCHNGTKDYAETDVDCGFDAHRNGCDREVTAEGCGPCADGRACVTDDNCKSQLCVNGVCAAMPGDGGARD